MPDYLIPNFEDSEAEDDQENQTEPPPEAGRKRSRKARILSADECLRALSAIPGLVAMGVLSTAQANSLRGTYQAILQHHRQGSSATSTTLPPTLQLGQALLDHPELATVLEPLLSREQIEKLLREAEDDDS